MINLICSVKVFSVNNRNNIGILCKGLILYLAVKITHTKFQYSCYSFLNSDLFIFCTYYQRLDVMEIQEDNWIDYFTSSSYSG